MRHDDFVPAPPPAGVGARTRQSEVRERRKRLLLRCQELAAFLRDHGESVWSGWIDARIAEIGLGQAEGVCNLLEGFAGLGNISDVFLCEEAGHCVSPDDEIAINEQFLLLLSSVNEGAYALQSVHEPVVVSRG